MHLVSPPKNILHNHHVRFLIGRLLYRGEIGNNGAIAVHVKMLNALLEHLLRKTLSFFMYFSLLCADHKHLQHTRTAVCKSGLEQYLASLY